MTAENDADLPPLPKGVILKGILLDIVEKNKQFEKEVVKDDDKSRN